MYLGAGLEAEHSCLLVVIGARAEGTKDLLALELGYRESTESWATVLRSLRERGLAAPLVAVGDGGLGLWAALATVYPSTRHQRCWNHRAMNLADRLPKRLHPEFRARFRALYLAPTREACETARDELALWLHAQAQDPAAETLYRDWDDFTTFYDPEGRQDQRGRQVDRAGHLHCQREDGRWRSLHLPLHHPGFGRQLRLEHGYLLIRHRRHDLQRQAAARPQARHLGLR